MAAKYEGFTVVYTDDCCCTLTKAVNVSQLNQTATATATHADVASKCDLPIIHQPTSVDQLLKISESIMH